MQMQSVVPCRNHGVCPHQSPSVDNTHGRQASKKGSLLSGVRTFLIVLLPWLIRYVFWRLTKE